MKNLRSKLLFLVTVAIILTGFSIRIFADGGMVAIITNNIISTQPQGVVSSNKNILIKDADSSEWQTSLNNSSPIIRISDSQVIL